MTLLFRRIPNIALGLIIPILIILLWYVSFRLSLLPKTIISNPLDVTIRFWELIQNGELKVHILSSGKYLVLGILIGVLLGVSTGISLAAFSILEKFISPTLQLLSPVPILAWTPILIVIFGISGSKIALISLGTFFIMAFSTFQAIRSTEQRYIELADTLRLSQFELLKHVLFPYALPQMFSSIRVAVSMSWILLLAAEMFASSDGLGWLIWDSRTYARTDDMFVGMITIGLLGWASDASISLMTRLLTPWRITFVGK